MVARYEWSGHSVGLTLLPAALRKRVAARREHISGVEIDGYATALGTKFPARGVESLVQVKMLGDDCAPAFSQGRTLRNSATMSSLKFERQTVRRSRFGTAIQTTLHHPSGWLAHHNLSWARGSSWLESTTTIENTTRNAITLELLSSFSLSGITPFAADDAPGRMRIHRFRSVWCMEGRLETRTMEDLQLERSFAGWGVRSERFGVVGSMPCNGFFPCAAIEDMQAGVVWGAQIAHNASWQMEFYRRDDAVAFSGGLADREFGHWMKRLSPKESLTSPTAFLACVEGNVDDCCSALVAAQKPALKNIPKSELSLPVIFNEWATSWGKPSHDNMVALAGCLRGLGITYLVMDAGWYAPPDGVWSQSHGDWIPGADLYPNGLSATADAVRKAGFVPGVWFEMETCGRDSQAFHRVDLLLHRDGIPLTIGDRRFFDLQNRRAVSYLTSRVIGLLRKAGFGYLKVDYNDTTGIGADGADSPGEAQRLQAAASRAIFQKIREELPDLVIENCSSGGHRLEPSMFALTSMSSFSDAHECQEIPVIAANLHRLMLPRQSQIWAVLRSGESERRTTYSLAAGFLGRLCLSGDALQWSPHQREMVREAISFYRRVAPIICDGRSFRYGPDVTAYRHPEGWQCVLRVGTNGEILAVAHTFAKVGISQITIPLPAGSWRIDQQFGSFHPAIRKSILVLDGTAEFSAGVVHLIPNIRRKAS
ncbi:MAG: glycoside hydrolase family 36 protein [Verrucomicrobiae bacterium]